MNTILLSSTTSAIMDGAAILIICAFIIHGARNGFVKTFFGVFGGFFSLLFAVLLCGSVAKTLETHYKFITSLSARLNGTLSGIFGEELMNTPLSESGNLTSNTAGWILNIIKNLGVLEELDQTTTLGNIICPIFAYYIVAILGAILLFIIFKLIFFVVGEIVYKMHAFTIIKVADNFLGAVLGILRGVIIIQSILMIIKIIPILFFQNIIAEIPGTFFVSLLYNGNIFEQIINAFLNSNITEIILSILN